MASRILTVSIISPDGPVFQGEASSVSLPGRLFPFEVLPGHAPIISTLDGGCVRIMQADGQETRISIRSGAARVKDNAVTICAEM